MPVNLALGHVSNDFLIAALVIYSLSVVAFAGDFAFGRPRRADSAALGQQARERTAALAVPTAARAAARSRACPRVAESARRGRPKAKSPANATTERE